MLHYSTQAEAARSLAWATESFRLRAGGRVRVISLFLGFSWAAVSTAAAGQASRAVAAALPDAPIPALALSAGLQEAHITISKSSELASEAPVVIPMMTMFSHSPTWPIWISGQANFIFQTHPNFHSPYAGMNSFTAPFEYKVSMVGTLFTGLQIPGTNKLTEVLFDEESAAGRGLSQALGLAGFTNLDVVRNPNLGPVPYVARWIITQTLPLSSETVELQRNPFSLATSAAVRRLVFHVGKMGVPDLFDQNEVGSDSHLQFTNWAIDNNGAWDYAADTRGYTRGIAVEYFDRYWEARYGFFQMPTVANGINLSWDFHNARGQNAEIVLNTSRVSKRAGKIRVLGFWNNGHMGNYRQAIQGFLDGEDTAPEITAHEHYDALKYGLGLNLEQSLTSQTRVYSRFGWNEGQHESYCYTEIDQTFQAGADHTGVQWGRPTDKVGVAFATNGISKDHWEYLKLGGRGFLLGDGTLNYRRENIVEAYYNLHVWRGLFYALGFSFVDNPGYNHDRGPVYVPSVRGHIDF